MSITETDVEGRFWSKVDRSADGCWPWRGCRGRDGYGAVTIGGRKLRAHRYSYSICVGPIPSGLLVLHSCDNRVCVNPAHLSVGTQKDNMRDCVERGRTREQKKTHCAHGHEYTPENTYPSNNGKARVCRTCNLAKQALYRAARRAQ